MTDATAGRGGVGIRLYTEGGQVVKRTFDQVGDSGKKMWAEIALGERAANPAVRALSAGAGEAKGAVEGLAARAGSASSVLAGFGATGLAVAASLGAVALGLQRAREGMQFAADLTDAADRIGVGAEALQEMRYVADEAGVSIDSVQANMEKLNGVVGAFKLGVGDGKLKPIFQELGITKEQLGAVDDAQGMMLLLADTLGQISDRAAQVRLARGLGVEESLPILRLGSEGIRRLSDDARELGLVMDDDVRARFDEADRSMERAQQRIDMALRSSVVSLAEEFAGLVEAIAAAVQWLDRLQVYSVTDNPATQAGTWVNRRVRDLAAGRNGAESEAFWNPLGRDIGDRVAAFQTTPDDKWIAGGGFERLGHSAKGGGGSSAEAVARQREREAEQRRQREERAQQQLERATDDIAKSYDKGNLSIDGKAAYAVADLERERASRLREIARAEEEYIRSKGLRGLTEVEAEQLRAKQAELTEQKKAIVEWDRRREIAVRRLKDDEDAATAANDILSYDSQLAKTQAERYRIEREILLSTIEIARKRKRAELENDPELDDEQRQARMAIFERQSSLQVKVLDNSETERLRAVFKSYGQEVTAAIREGRIGEYIGDQLKQRLLDGALDQLFNMLSKAGSSSGGGGADGGGWVNTAFNFAKTIFSGGGRAAGGGTEAGGFYTTVEHGKPELFMIGGNGHVTSAVETARMLRETLAETGAASGSTAAPIVNMPAISIHAPGADAAALRRVEDRLEKLQRDMPGMAVRAVNDVRQRNHGG